MGRLPEVDFFDGRKKELNLFVLWVSIPTDASNTLGVGKRKKVLVKDEFGSHFPEPTQQILNILGRNLLALTEKVKNVHFSVGKLKNLKIIRHKNTFY